MKREEVDQILTMAKAAKTLLPLINKPGLMHHQSVVRSLISSGRKQLEDVAVDSSAKRKVGTRYDRMVAGGRINKHRLYALLKLN
jgi:hypothetical protein